MRNLVGTLSLALLTIIGCSANIEQGDSSHDTIAHPMDNANRTIVSNTLPALHWINVKDFGATGDGKCHAGDPDTVAFKKAIAEIPSTGASRDSRGVVLYVPPGRYCLTSQLAIADIAMTLAGGGPQVSVLEWTAVNGGVSFTSSAIGVPFTVRDLSFLTTKQGGGVAIEAAWVPYLGTSEETAFIDNVEIHGSGGQNSINYWNTGIRLAEANASQIRRVEIKGAINDPAKMVDGIWLVDTKIGTDHGAADYLLSDIRIFFAQFAVRTSGYDVEGVNIAHSSFVAVEQGILWGTSGTSGVPHLALANSFINSFKYGVNINGNLTQAFITGNLFYQQGTGTNYAIAAIGTPEQPTQLHISDNIFSGSSRHAGPDGPAIDFNGVNLGNSVTFSHVVNNTFVGNSVPIYLGNTTSDNIVSGNLFNGTIGTYGGSKADIWNLGKRNIVSNPMNASLTLSAGWSATGLGTINPGYYIDTSGVVHLEGLVKGTRVGTIIANLPPRAHPLGLAWYPVYTSAGTFGSLQVAPNGDLTLTSGDPAAVSLDGVAFRAAPFPY